jgi:hypothetical protein
MYLLIPSPEPERFYWEEKREILYLNPLPHPQHLAEGLPVVTQERPDGLVPILLRYRTCIWCIGYTECTKL